MFKFSNFAKILIKLIFLFVLFLPALFPVEVDVEFYSTLKSLLGEKYSFIVESLSEFGVSTFKIIYFLSVFVLYFFNLRFIVAFSIMSGAFLLFIGSIIKGIVDLISGNLNVYSNTIFYLEKFFFMVPMIAFFLAILNNIPWREAENEIASKIQFEDKKLGDCVKFLLLFLKIMNHIRYYVIPEVVVAFQSLNIKMEIDTIFSQRKIFIDFVTYYIALIIILSVERLGLWIEDISRI